MTSAHTEDLRGWAGKAPPGRWARADLLPPAQSYLLHLLRDHLSGRVGGLRLGPAALHMGSSAVSRHKAGSYRRARTKPSVPSPRRPDQGGGGMGAVSTQGQMEVLEGKECSP